MAAVALTGRMLNERLATVRAGCHAFFDTFFDCRRVTAVDAKVKALFL
jgi:hypothetical protein